MTFPVSVKSNNGRFAAAVMGEPQMRAIGATRAEALAALTAMIQERVGSGEMVSLDVGTSGISALAGKYADDPTLREICEEAYQLRDSEPQE